MGGGRRDCGADAAAWGAGIPGAVNPAVPEVHVLLCDAQCHHRGPGQNLDGPRAAHPRDAGSGLLPIRSGHAARAGPGPRAQQRDGTVHRGRARSGVSTRSDAMRRR